ncbi:hypothetical protein CK489_08220 [Bradyrhizobium sp. UFLA03-84]|nr:hypothetical protein CK489_08220 [Bradyrhizobium sp. UFLA03-84]
MVARLKDALIGQGGVSGRDQEAPFLRKLTRKAPADLEQLLTAIDAYETFGRAITDAFDALRYCASSHGGAPVDAQTFSASKTVGSSLALLKTGLGRVRAHSALLEWERDEKGIAQAVDRFEDVQTANDLFEALLHHHEQVQREKPPNGKRAWFERGPRGRVVLRSGYTLREPPTGKAGYVHEYRVPTFSRFLSDLGALR